MKISAVSVVSTLLVLSLGCGSEPANEDVVAVFQGGRVSFADLDAAILELPASRRHPSDGNFTEWYGDLARGIALQRIVRAEAKREGLDLSPEFQKLEEDLRRRATVSVFLRHGLPQEEPISSEEVRAFYDAYRHEFRRSASRRVYHIFKRFTPGVSEEFVRKQMEDLGQRIASGEDFETLATEYSDSETRHDGGLLGWVERGDMSPDLERIIFSLEVGTVSAPVTSKAGIHLFLISSASEEKQFTFDEVSLQILNRLRLQQRSQTIERIAGEALPANSFVPHSEELLALLDAGEPESLVLRIGAWSMRLDEFLEALWVAGLANGPNDPEPRPMNVLNSLKQRELIYLHCQQRGIDANPEVEEQLDRLRARELVDFALRRRLFNTMDGREQDLRDHYESNRKRFSEPLRLQIQRFGMPLTDRANDHLARLEQSREALDWGETSFTDLAAELGGQIDDLGWQTLGQMMAGGGRMAQMASRLEPGRHSPPWRTTDRLEMILVVARREPQTQSFKAVRQRVLGDYLLHHGPEVQDEIIQAWLREAGFELFPERLEALHLQSFDEAQGVESAASDGSREKAT